MSHIRKQIRDAVAALVTGLPLTGANVFVSRSIAVAKEQRPALCIYTLEEASGLDGSAQGLRREVTVIINIVLHARDSFDDDVDAIAVNVETAMAAQRTLGGLAYDCVLQSTRIGLQGQGENTVALAEMSFLATTRTAITNPQATY